MKVRRVDITPHVRTAVFRLQTENYRFPTKLLYAVAYVPGSFGDFPAPRLWDPPPRRLRDTLPVSRASWGQSLSPRFRPRPLATVAERPSHHWLWPDGWDSVSQPMSKIKFRRQASLSIFQNTLALSTEQGYYSTIHMRDARGYFGVSRSFQKRKICS